MKTLNNVLDASKSSTITTEKTPLKATLQKCMSFKLVYLPFCIIYIAKSDEENRKIQDLIQQKRQQQDEILPNEKYYKDEQERIRKDKLNKETSHHYLHTSLTKKTSAFTPVRLVFILFLYSIVLIDKSQKFN